MGAINFSDEDEEYVDQTDLKTPKTLISHKIQINYKTFLLQQEVRNTY